MLLFTNNRIILNIFGVKFKFLRKTSKKEREQFSSFYNSFKTPEDIPKAEGSLRLFQEACLQLLIEFRKFCVENNLNFWLDFGTLLGAARHKGYIPWDDDIDVSMMRDDYEKLIKLFEDTPQNYPDLSIVTCFNGKNRCFIKLKSNICKNVFIDIFPYDYYYEPLDKKGKKRLSKLVSIINTFNKISFSQDLKQVKLKLKKQTHNIILKRHNIDLSKKPAIYMAIDFPHGHKNKVYDYDTIFPLKEINFENEQFLAPNNYKKVLTDLFGNYLNIPKNVYPRHIACNAISNTEILMLKKYINRGDNNEFRENVQY